MIPFDDVVAAHNRRYPDGPLIRVWVADDEVVVGIPRPGPGGVHRAHLIAAELALGGPPWPRVTVTSHLVEVAVRGTPIDYVVTVALTEYYRLEVRR